MDKGSVCVKPEFGGGCDRGKRKTVYVYSSWRLLYIWRFRGDMVSEAGNGNQLPSVLPVDGNYISEEDRRKDRNLVCGAVIGIRPLCRKDFRRISAGRRKTELEIQLQCKRFWPVWIFMSDSFAWRNGRTSLWGIGNRLWGFWHSRYRQGSGDRKHLVYRWERSCGGSYNDIERFKRTDGERTEKRRWSGSFHG